VYDHFLIEHRTNCHLDFLFGVSLLQEEDKAVISKIIEDKNRRIETVNTIYASEKVNVKALTGRSQNNYPAGINDNIDIDGSIEFESVTQIGEDERLLLSPSILEPIVQITDASLEESSNIVDVTFSSEDNQCPVCDATLSSKANIRRHLKNVHKISNDIGGGDRGLSFETNLETIQQVNDQEVSDGTELAGLKNIKDKKRKANESIESTYKKFCWGNQASFENVMYDEISNNKVLSDTVDKEAIEEKLENEAESLVDQKNNRPPRTRCTVCNASLSQKSLRKHMIRFHPTTLQDCTTSKSVIDNVEAQHEKTTVEGVKESCLTNNLDAEIADTKSDTRTVCKLCNVNLSVSYLKRHLKRAHKTAEEDEAVNNAVTNDVSKETRDTHSKQLGASFFQDSSSFVEQMKMKLQLEDNEDEEKSIKHSTHKEGSIDKRGVIENLRSTQMRKSNCETHILRDPNLPPLWLVKYTIRPDKIDREFITPDKKRIRSAIKMIEYMRDCQQYTPAEIETVEEYFKKPKPSVEQLKSLKLNDN